MITSPRLTRAKNLLRRLETSLEQLDGIDAGTFTTSGRADSGAGRLPVDTFPVDNVGTTAKGLASTAATKMPRRLRDLGMDAAQLNKGSSSARRRMTESLPIPCRRTLPQP